MCETVFRRCLIFLCRSVPRFTCAVGVNLWAALMFFSQLCLLSLWTWRASRQWWREHLYSNHLNASRRLYRMIFSPLLEFLSAWGRKRSHSRYTHCREVLFFVLVPKTTCRVSPTFFKESFFFFSRTAWVWYFLLYYFTSRPRKEHKEQRSRPSTTLLLPSHPHFLLSGRRTGAPPQYGKPWTLLLRSTACPHLTVLLRAKRTVCWKSRYVAKSRRGL